MASNNDIGWTLRVLGYAVTYIAASLVVIYVLDEYYLLQSPPYWIELSTLAVQVLPGPLLALAFGMLTRLRSPLGVTVLVVTWVIPILFAQAIPCSLWSTCG